MPIYEYKCLSCGRQDEVMQKMSDPPMTTCEVCGGELKKLISAPAFQFKGDGWYVTDYARKKDGGKGGDKGGTSGGKTSGDEGGSKDSGSKDKGSGDGGSKDKGSGDGGSSSSSSGDSKGGGDRPKGSSSESSG